MPFLSEHAVLAQGLAKSPSLSISYMFLRVLQPERVSLIPQIALAIRVLTFKEVRFCSAGGACLARAGQGAGRGPLTGCWSVRVGKGCLLIAKKHRLFCELLLRVLVNELPSAGQVLCNPQVYLAPAQTQFWTQRSPMKQARNSPSATLTQSFP